MRPTSEISHNLSQLVDKKLGELYLVIENVNENLAEIRHVSHYMESLFDIHTNLADLLKLSTQDDALNFTTDNLSDLATFYANLNTLITNRTSLDALADEIQANADIAAKWAGEAEDTEVTTGLYSAMHHALKAAATQTAVQAIKDSAETSVQTIADAAANYASAAATSASASETHKNDAQTAQTGAETAQAAAEAAALIKGVQMKDILGRDYCVIVSAGQSNAETYAEGGVWNQDNNQLAWDDGTGSFVVSTQNTAPYRTLTPVRNHIGQHTGEFARALGVTKVYQIMVAYPGNSISQWVPNTQPNWIDMKAKIDAAVAEIAVLEGTSGVIVDLMTWQQGESDQNAVGSTFMENTLEFRDQIRNEAWWDDDGSTFIFGGLVRQDSTGAKNPNFRQHVTIEHLCGAYPEFFTYASTIGLYDNNDAIHFDGDDLRRMAKRFINKWWAKLRGFDILVEQQNLVYGEIAENINFNVGSGHMFETLEEFFKFLNTKKIAVSANATAILQDEIYDVDTAIIDHPDLDRVSIQGSANYTVPVPADFTGVDSTDIAKALTTDWFGSRIRFTGYGFQFRKNMRKLSRVAIVGDTANEGGVTAGEGYIYDTGTGGCGLEDVLIIGFPKGISAIGSGTSFRKTGGYVGIAHCDVGITAQDSSSVEVSSIDLRHCTTGVICNNASVRLTSGVFTDCTTEITAGKKAFVKINGATYDAAKINVTVNTLEVSGTSRGALVDSSSGA